MSAADRRTCEPTGAVAGYRPERTLRLSVELRRQFKRRRTIGVFVADGGAAADPHRGAAPGRRRRRGGATAGSTWSTSPPPAA